MTCIAFKDARMACDSRCTDSYGAILTRTPKIDRLPSGALIGSAGDSDIRDVLKLLQSAKTKKSLPARADLAATKTEFAGLLALQNGGLFHIEITPMQMGDDVEWTACVTEVHDRIGAVGSGYQFALGAMAAGRSAAQGVAIACKYDIHCGLPVREVPLKPEGKKSKK